MSIVGTDVHYSNTAFPSTGINLFTITYYDNYLNIDLDAGTSSQSYNITPITNPKGLLVCTKVRVLDQSPAQWITSVNYYDGKGRTVYSYSKNNFLSTVSNVKSRLDFAGNVLETVSTHKKGSDSEIVLTNSFTYDHMGRLLSQKQKINSQQEETIALHTYDNLGQLITKIVGGVQTVNYNYNIRGWLKNINDVNNIGTDLFAFQINYNDAADASKRLYNGNISQTFWKTAHTDTSLRSYTYTYDALNRLTASVDNLGHYNENPSYDKNGNVMTMSRNGNTVLNNASYGVIDNLVYTYDGGNRLLKVEDGSGNTLGFDNGNSGQNTDYTYDDNGNMKTDANKGITSAISYNHLNLPTQIIFPAGSIEYSYDASGAKQRKTAGTITTDYAGGFQYENGVLQFFPHQEGYVRYNSGIYEYIYQYKDHLGNIRLSYNKNLNIIEESNYYPFGLEQKSHINIVNTVGNAAAQKYKYQGQERQDELGLNWDSFKWRNYDPAIGRFMSIDPLAEKYAYNSTYAFQENKMGMGVELEGLELFSPWLEVAFGTSDVVRLTTEVGGKTSEFAGKTSEIATKSEGTGKFSKTQLENFAKGNATESEQLLKNGLEKNTKPYEATDPKTGKEGTTIPDSMKPDGGTVEIKNVKSQGLTKQLRLQKAISEGAGVKPELIINESANLSKPLQNAGFDIKTYGTSGTTIESTGVAKPKTNLIPLQSTKLEIKIISLLPGIH